MYLNGAMPALRQVSVHLDAGELVSIIGSNGAGKTTLLKTISGLLQPAAGSIHFRGEKIDGLPTYEICKRGSCRSPKAVKFSPDESDR